MDPILAAAGWIMVVVGVFGLGAFFTRLYDEIMAKRGGHQATPFRHGGFQPTRPPASLVPPSGESARTAVTPPPGRARPFPGEADIDRQIDEIVREADHA